jgi:hypothetical protein
MSHQHPVAEIPIAYVFETADPSWWDRRFRPAVSPVLLTSSTDNRHPSGHVAPVLTINGVGALESGLGGPYQGIVIFNEVIGMDGN